MSSSPASSGPAAGLHDGPGFVLLVDDEPLLLRALERILRLDGHRILLARSAAEIVITVGGSATSIDVHLP